MKLTSNHEDSDSGAGIDEGIKPHVAAYQFFIAPLIEQGREYRLLDACVLTPEPFFDTLDEDWTRRQHAKKLAPKGAVLDTSWEPELEWVRR